MPECCLRGQNMLKQLSLRGGKIKWDKKVSLIIAEAFFQGWRDMAPPDCCPW